jgi:hypothetical protein
MQARRLPRKLFVMTAFLMSLSALSQNSAAHSTLRIMKQEQPGTASINARTWWFV